MKKLFLTVSSLFCLLLAAEEKPILKAGIITDTHITPQESSCFWVEKALKFFKKNKVDLVINCGDIADEFYPEGYRHYRNTIKKIYPQGIREIFAYAFHDQIHPGNRGIRHPYSELQAALQIPHEPMDFRLINGLPFLIFPQTIESTELYEKKLADTAKKFPGKPIFVIDHIPALNTTHNSITAGSIWKRPVLNKFPQVIHISGHTHNSLFNEQCIWQGEYTAVNAGCLKAFFSSDTPERNTYTEVLIMEVYRNKVLFRRYSLPNEKEYRPSTPWCVPLPFVPETAPYNPKRRYADSEEPAFPADAKISFTPDRIPFTSVEISFPSASPDVLTCNITVERKNQQGEFELFTEKDISGNYKLPENERNKNLKTFLPSGYFEAGKEYRFTITPINFYGKKGKALKAVWKAPEIRKNQILFESRNPMEELPFITKLTGGVQLKKENGFYIYDTHTARLEFPPEIWDLPVGTPLRFTAVIHTIQNQMKTLLWDLRNLSPRRPVSPYVITKTGNDLRLHVIDFKLQVKGDKYCFLLQGDVPCKIRFNYIKVEKLSR